MKQSDKVATDRIVATMEDYESDMNNYAGQLNKGDRTRAGELLEYKSRACPWAEHTHDVDNLHV